MVLRGSGRMKLDDEIVELKEWDAVRVPPGTWRGYEAGPEGLEIIARGSWKRRLTLKGGAFARWKFESSPAHSIESPAFAGLSCVWFGLARTDRSAV